MIEVIGYGGPTPLAIILWYAPGGDKPSYKTVCYDESEVIAAYERHVTPGDLYNTLRPSINYAGDPQWHVATA